MKRSTFIREALPAAAIATFVGAGLAGTADAQDKPTTENPPADNEADMAEARALLKSLDAAYNNHDLEGVKACFGDVPRVILMGTGSGEYWIGKEAIGEAYTEMFKDFDKGSEKFDYKLRRGSLSSDMGYLTTAGLVTSSKDGKPHEYVLNVSLVVQKLDGAWKIVSLHYSNLTGDEITVREA